MYRFPSASVRYAPSARSTNGGAPPTALNALTGEFTPPGKKRSARSCNSRDLLRLCVLIVELIVPLV